MKIRSLEIKNRKVKIVLSSGEEIRYFIENTYACSTKGNDVIFRRLGLDKYDVINSLGVIDSKRSGGNWPWCKDLAGIIKVFEYLRDNYSEELIEPVIEDTIIEDIEFEELIDTPVSEYGWLF